MSLCEFDRLASWRGHGSDIDEQERTGMLGGTGWKERNGISLIVAAEGMVVSIDRRADRRIRVRDVFLIQYFDRPEISAINGRF